ncbi:5,6-dimethylbenzimidazole synthase [Loktanella sp. DJP18]|uniref:5,6-dimethylbenzimidazole synthase n=1 Tax=Loktanella sp. DJP18 TaxID=3409788 RepID=UPI003BB72152
MRMTATHRDALDNLLRWRRDVRHFRPDPIPQDRLDRLRDAMDMAPSVGNARPWRVMQVASPTLRAAVVANFEEANAEAAAHYADDRRAAYDRLKLAGLREAPVHLAIFTARDPGEGHGLGRQTMPQTLAFSTVCAIHGLWLAARADNIGVGWVSILDPDLLHATLNAQKDWDFTAYLCLGLPASDDDTPLLHRTDWQANTATCWQRV